MSLIINKWPKDMNYTKYELLYDSWDITKEDIYLKLKIILQSIEIGILENI